MIAGYNLSYKAFFKKLKSITKQSQILVPIPKTILLLLGAIGGFLRYLGITTSLSLANMKALCINNYYSNQKSKVDLGVSYSSLDTAVKESVDYFRAKL